MDQQRTSVGAARSGFDYQDLVAAESFIRVLERPSRYRWVKLEAKEAGKLDDVVVLRADGLVEATQVKFSRDALAENVAWTWRRLLDKKDEQSKSLLQDWCESVALLDSRYERTIPRLVSNRRAGFDLYLQADGHVDKSQTDSKVLTKVQEQLGDSADDFLERFTFSVNHQDHEDFEELLLRRFEALRLTDDKWYRFKDRIRDWIRGQGLPKSGELSIDLIRNACGWRQLRPLPQGLEIPKDFTLPSERFHAEFRERVETGYGTAIVLTAGPGVGKSTYLSFLVQELQNAGHPVVRHHYALSVANDDAERLDARRAAESLMEQIASALDSEITDLGTQHLDPDDLRQWLSKVGEDLVAEGRGVVVIIDGLDHVWRETGSNEALRELFQQLLPPPDGVAIVVGTQPVEDQQLPPSLLRHVPSDDRAMLPKFDPAGIAEWLRARQGMEEPDDDEPAARALRDVAAALYAKTNGHPLLMRFAVDQIEYGNEALSEDAVAALPETLGGSVEDYYRSLWRGLPAAGRDVAYLVATASFPWIQQGLLECLSLAGYERGGATAGLAALQHLLAEDELGLSPFHSSFLVFVRKQGDFAARASELRELAIRWLQEKAPEHWRRSYLWKLQLEAGDPNPLLDESTREWAVEAIAVGHAPEEVVEILQEAAWTAIEHRDLPKYVDRGILADAIRESTIHEDAYSLMFSAQLATASDEHLEARCLAKLHGLSDPQIVMLASHLKSRDGAHDPLVCLEEMVRRIRGRIKSGRGEANGLTRARAFAVLAGLTQRDSSKTANFINQFESDDTRAVVVEGWVEGLRQAQDVGSSVAALGDSVGVRGGRYLSHHVALMALEQRASLQPEIVDSLHPLYAAIYNMACGIPLGPAIPDEPDSSRSSDALLLDQAERSFTVSIHDIFFFLVVRELQSPGFSESWRPAGSVRPWLLSAIRQLATGAVRVAEELKRGREINVTAAFESTRSLSPQRMVHPLEDYESSAGLRRALVSITEDLLVIRGRQGGSPRLDWPEVEQVVSHRFSNALDVLECAAKQQLKLENRSVLRLCERVDEELSRVVEPFSERAKAYSVLAAVAAQHGRDEEANTYLRRAAENLVSHGYHKDMVVHSALDAIEASADRFTTRDSLWLRLAPVIASMDQFTDGDETRHLPSRLGSLLLDFDQQLGVEYLAWLLDTEEFHDVESVLNDIVRNDDLTDPVLRALVATCIDPESLYALEQRRDDASLRIQELLDLSPRYSATLAEANTRSSDDRSFAPSADENNDKYLTYPPDQLDKLIESEDLAWIPTRGKALCMWLVAWAATPQAHAALNAVEPYFRNDNRLRVSIETVAAVADIAGRERSYDWLVWSQRTNNGWYEYWTSEAEAEQRWALLKRDFPDRWHHFLTESVRPVPGWTSHFGPTIARIVRFLVLLEEDEEARAATSQVVATVSGLVAGQDLPVPRWAQRLKDES
ncbi:MAG: dsDNA nuclease domain-containing protein [Chloroflexota bacterium]|nr:dsDNA nuclease domain-containing protein [Chloroflexota bacterium]MDE2894346.1 dsDNA nuclease domain-containing protein [Chloroflexota bacterium]